MPQPGLLTTVASIEYGQIDPSDYRLIGLAMVMILDRYQLSVATRDRQ